MTTLRSCADASALLTPGAAWTLAFETRDASGYRTGAVAPAVTVTLPDASPATVVPTYVADGLWTALYTVATAGRYTAHVATPEDALDYAAYVLGVTTVSGIPTADDCARYLGPRAGSWTPADIADALAAERTAQRGKCGEWAVFPDDLREALFRRVARNLAMRMMPLAVAVGDADVGPSILPGRDPEVRRFEEPYRRMPIG